MKDDLGNMNADDSIKSNDKNKYFSGILKPDSSLFFMDHFKKNIAQIEIDTFNINTSIKTIFFFGDN